MCLKFDIWLLVLDSGSAQVTVTMTVTVKFYFSLPPLTGHGSTLILHELKSKGKNSKNKVLPEQKESQPYLCTRMQEIEW